MPVFGLALEYWAVHQVMYSYFLVAGYLVHLHPAGCRRTPMAPRPVRILTAAGAAAAFLVWSLVLAATVQILQADWFGNMGRTWGAPLAVDQQLAGISVLLAGFLPTAAIMAMLMFAAQPRDRPPRG